MDQRGFESILDKINLALAVLDDQGNILWLSGFWQAAARDSHDPLLSLAQVGEVFPNLFAKARSAGIIQPNGSEDSLEDLLTCAKPQISIKYSAINSNGPVGYHLVGEQLNGELINGRPGRALIIHRALETDPEPARDHETIAHPAGSLPDLVVRFDRQLRILSINSAVLQYFGTNGDDWIGKTVARFKLPEVTHERWISALQQAITYRYQAEIVHSQQFPLDLSRTITLQTRFVPEINQGEAGSVLVVVRDISHQSKMEAELRLFRTIIERSREAIAIGDASGHFIYINPAHEKLFGRNLAEAQEKSYFDYYPPKSVEILKNVVQPALNKGEGWEGTLDVFGPEGNVFPLWERADSIHDSQGNLQYTFGIMHDVSDEQAVVRALQESEARLHAILDQSQDGILLADVDDKIIEWSRGMQAITGLPREAVIGQPAAEILFQLELPERRSPPLREQMQALVHHLHLSGGHPGINHLQEKWIAHTEDQKLVQSQFFTIPGPSGYLLGLSMRDITAQQCSLEQLHLVTTSLEAVANGIVITNPEGNIAWANPAFSRLTGYSLDEALGKNPRDLVRSGLQTEEFYRHLWQTIQSGKVWRGTLTNRRKNGEFYQEEMTITPVTQANRKISHFIAVKQDITERHAIEQERQAVTGLAAELRHAESRAALTSIIIHHVRALLRSDAAALVILSKENGEFITEQASGAWEPFLNKPLMTNQGISSLVFDSRQPYLNDDLRIEAQLPEESRQGLNYAVLGVPLLTRQGVMGVIWVGRQHSHIDKPPQTFSSTDVKLLTAVADMAANALKRAALHEETAQYAAQLANLYLSSRRLAHTLDFDEIFSQLKQAIAALYPDITGILIFHRNRSSHHSICVHAQINQVEVQPAELGLTEAWLNQTTLPEHTGSLQEAVFVTDLAMQITLSESEKQPREMIRSAIHVPLLMNGENHGQISVLSTYNTRFNHTDAQLLTMLADAASAAMRSADALQNSRRHVQRLLALRTIDQAITSSIDLQDNLRVVLDQVMEQLNVDAAAIYLHSQENNMLELGRAHGFRTPSDRYAHIPINSSLTGKAALARETIFHPVLEVVADQLATRQVVEDEGFITFFGVPLIAKGELHGVLDVFFRKEIHPDQDWQNFLEALAGQAAIAIDNATLFEHLQNSHLELEQSYDTTLEGWARALELRDEETEGHTRRVTELSVRLAEVLGIQGEPLTNLRRGAMLHDIGKVAIPDSILFKPGPLDEAEWEIMRQHPSYAIKLLNPIPYLKDALDIPNFHHEKWDGSGYPQGFKGNQIPLAARIFAVVDVYDALRSDRPYRPAWPEDRILDYLRSQSGKHFDPMILEVFLQEVQPHAAEIIST